MKASELVKKLRDAVFDHPDYGPVVSLGVMDADHLTSLADLIEAQAKALEAARALLDHWDECDGPEKRGSFDGVEYWSPAGRMVDTQVIADLRKALASHSKEGEHG